MLQICPTLMWYILADATEPWPNKKKIVPFWIISSFQYNVSWLYFQPVMRLCVLFAILWVTSRSNCFVQVVVIITMATVYTQLLRWILLYELAGSVQIVKFVKCAGKKMFTQCFFGLHYLFSSNHKLTCVTNLIIFLKSNKKEDMQYNALQNFV